MKFKNFIYGVEISYGAASARKMARRANAPKKKRCIGHLKVSKEQGAKVSLGAPRKRLLTDL